MRERTGDLFAHICLTYRKSVLLLVLCLTVVATLMAGRVAFDNDMGVWFLNDDPAMIAHDELLKTFGSDEYIMIGLGAPDVFAPDILRSLDRVTRAVEEAPHIEKVFSLANIEAIEGDAGMLEVGDLIEYPLAEDELPEIRRRALQHSLYVGNILSADGTYTAVVARLPDTSGHFEWKLESVGAIREILAQEVPLQYVMVGGTVIDERFDMFSRQDSIRSGGLMGLILMVTLFVLLRTKAGIAVPLATVFVALIWTVGLMGAVGRDANVITTLLPPLILAVGVADSMHIMVDYYARCRAGRTREDALREMYRELSWPCTLTSLTTCIGMLSLSVGRLQGMREFSVFAAAGVFSAYLLSLTFVPIVLSYLPVPKSRTPHPEKTHNSARLTKLYEFNVQWEKPIFAGAVLLFLTALLGASRVQAESVFLEFFKDSDPIRADTEHFQDRMSGSLTMEIMVDTKTTDGIQDPALLVWIDRLQTMLENQSNITSSQSIADYFKDMRRAFFDGDQREYRLPDSREEASQYLLLYEMSEPDGDIFDYVTFDHRQTRVSARLLMASSAAANQAVSDTEAWIAANPPPVGETRIAGLTLLYARMEEYIRETLIRGFSVALVAVCIIMCLQMRSVVLGLISMLPNILPITVGLGAMGFLDIQLDSVTTMVASISIGIAVDDTIHFVTRTRYHLDQGASMPDALRLATVHVGRALIYTSLTLFAGFGVMLTNNLQPMINFGLLCTITIVAALASDLLLLPILMRWAHRREPVSTNALSEAAATQAV